MLDLEKTPEIRLELPGKENAEKQFNSSKAIIKLILLII